MKKMKKTRLIQLNEALMEDAVDAAKKAQYKLADSFLTLEGESPEDARQRMKDVRAAAKQAKKKN